MYACSAVHITYIFSLNTWFIFIFNSMYVDHVCPKNGLSPIFEILRMLLRVSDFTKMGIFAQVDSFDKKYV